MHRSMTGVSADLSQALEDAIKRASAQANEQRLFAEAAKDMQSQVLREVEIAQAKVHSRLGDFVQNFEDRLMRLLGFTTKSMQQVAEAADELGESIRESFQDVDVMRSKLEAIMTDVSEQSQHLSAAQRQELQTHQEAALALRNTIATARDSEISELSAAFASLQNELRASTQLISLMATHQSSHNNWLQRLDSAFANLQETAVSLGQMQQIHAENQTRLFEDLSLRVGETESAFGAMVGKMGTLATLIDEKTAIVGALGFFSGLGWMMVRCLLVMVVAGVVGIVLPGNVAGFTIQALVIVFTLVVIFGPNTEGLLAYSTAVLDAMPSSSSLLRFWPAALPGVALGAGVLVLCLRRRRSRAEGVPSERAGCWCHELSRASMM